MIEDQEVIALFGNTGSGKSTFINYILGKKMIKNLEKDIIVDPIDQEIAKIGIETCS